MGTAIQHPVPDRVKPSFVILTSRHSDAEPRMATVGVKGLNVRNKCLIINVQLTERTCRPVSRVQPQPATLRETLCCRSLADKQPNETTELYLNFTLKIFIGVEKCLTAF